METVARLQKETAASSFELLSQVAGLSEGDLRRDLNAWRFFWHICLPADPIRAQRAQEDFVSRVSFSQLGRRGVALLAHCGFSVPSDPIHDPARVGLLDSSVKG